MTKLTGHAKTRAQQRGIKLSVLSLVVEDGTEVTGGVLFTEQDFERVVSEEKARLAELERSREEAKARMASAERARGVFVPVKDDAVPTIYKATPRQRSWLIGGRRGAAFDRHRARRMAAQRSPSRRVTWHRSRHGRPRRWHR